MYKIRYLHDSCDMQTDDALGDDIVFGRYSTWSQVWNTTSLQDYLLEDHLSLGPIGSLNEDYLDAD